ncbi:hypothetical protein D5R93_01265 [Actinomyces lilanjuaniae]|uniref:Uncharacterized protein n=1 Tax=Actinomyces lilanjuaniae TaxID=2321394 RepID=A0ABM6Z1K7_9ACTO|nr:hypothetical protein [Actinomyces lilanjuaniae]AYD89025.1 hypothetical protein D5R93_01265 [Actinomyces lilanjuaniae]
MPEWSFEAQMEAVDSLQTHLAEFMRSAGVSEVVVEVQCVGTRAAARTRALRPGGDWEENVVPGPIVEESVRLRSPMARPGGGAWTWASLTMSSRDYQLASDFDYDHQPQLTPPSPRTTVPRSCVSSPVTPGPPPTGWLRDGVDSLAQERRSDTGAWSRGDAGGPRP